jgi:hypothetical protein
MPSFQHAKCARAVLSIFGRQRVRRRAKREKLHAHTPDVARDNVVPLLRLGAVTLQTWLCVAARCGRKEQHHCAHNVVIAPSSCEKAHANCKGRETRRHRWSHGPLYEAFPPLRVSRVQKKSHHRFGGFFRENTAVRGRRWSDRASRPCGCMVQAASDSGPVLTPCQWLASEAA